MTKDAKDLGGLSIEDLGALICESLMNAGVRVTLSGGACAQIYSCNKHVTGDLDFVVNFVWSEDQEKINRVMSKLGFRRTGRIFVSDAVAYAVEFPPGPLGIGDEYEIRPVEKKLKTGTLSLLSATDSAKDRLAGFFYGNDLQCLEQAVWICRMNSVDMENIRTWALRENRPERLREFERLIAEAHNTDAAS